MVLVVKRYRRLFGVSGSFGFILSRTRIKHSNYVITDEILGVIKGTDLRFDYQISVFPSPMWKS